MLIGIQAGHENIGSNVDPNLRSGTGAPGEKDTNVRIRNRLGQILVSKGFQVQLDDANANGNKSTTGKDFTFYLSLHCEANTHGKGGGFMTAPDPNFDDNNTESKRIIEAIKSLYFKNTGIVEHEEWITAAMTQYYMWSSLSSKTPCGIIEMGVVQDAHDSVLLNDTDRIANAIARGICSAFNVNFDAPKDPSATDIYKGKDLTDKTLMMKAVDAQILIESGQYIDKNSCPKPDPKYLNACKSIQQIINNLG